MLFDQGKDGKDFIYYEDNKTITESIVLRLFKPLMMEKKEIFFLMDGIHQLVYLTNYQS